MWQKDVDRPRREMSCLTWKLLTSRIWGRENVVEKRTYITCDFSHKFIHVSKFYNRDFIFYKKSVNVNILMLTIWDNCCGDLDVCVYMAAKRNFVLNQERNGMRHPLFTGYVAHILLRVAIWKFLHRDNFESVFKKLTSLFTHRPILAQMKSIQKCTYS